MMEKQDTDLRRFVEERAAPKSVPYTTKRRITLELDVYKEERARNWKTLWLIRQKKLEKIATIHNEPEPPPEVRIHVRDEWIEEVLKDYEENVRKIGEIKRNYN